MRPLVHHGQQCLDQEKRTFDVYVEGVVEIGNIKFVKWFIDKFAGIVDQDVAFMDERFQTLHDKGIKLELVQVKFIGCYLCFGIEVHTFGNQFFKRFAIARDGHNLILFMPGKHLYEFVADTLACPGNYDVHIILILLIKSTISIFGMCRTDTTGNLDTTFHSIITSGIPYPIYVQNDGKIIVCGDMKIIGNPTRLRFIRLNIDGSLDSTFNNFNSIVYIPNTPCAASVACPTTDGGYLIGGQFRQYQGYVHNNIAKTDANGFIDTTYFNGLGIDSVLYPNLGIPPYVNSIVKGSNDNYYVMGGFTHYNGVKVNPIIRIHGLSVGINEVEKEKVMVFPNPANNSITFNTGLSQNYNLTIFNAIGQIVLQKQIIAHITTLNIQNFKQGMYYYTLINDKGKVINGKFIKN